MPTGVYKHQSIPAWERVLRRCEVGDCWEFTGYLQSGYGRVNDRGTIKQAYRVVWEYLIGPIPEGLELDHLCKNTKCVNPDHLEPVTHAENVRRSAWRAVHWRSRQTHCVHGHPLSGDNLYLTPNGRRQCRTCIRERSAKAYGKRVA